MILIELKKFILNIAHFKIDLEFKYILNIILK